MRIVTKWATSQIPKTIVHFMVNGIKEFLKNDVLVKLYEAETTVSSVFKLLFIINNCNVMLYVNVVLI